PRRPKRKIPKAPWKVLDAPALADDFYLNLVDWGASDVLAVGLGSAVYSGSALQDQARIPFQGIWRASGGRLATTRRRWAAGLCGAGRAAGAGAGGGGGCGCWAPLGRDRRWCWDPRQARPAARALRGHKQEVCGLRWSADGAQLASGGNDNQLFVWRPAALGAEGAGGAPACRFGAHAAAVKALAWSPHQAGLLASGGGTADRCIRFWNTLAPEGQQALSAVDTGSQVCNLMWSRTTTELVSTHGYSLNQVILWRYPSMTKAATLTGHTYRVLYLAMSPDGRTVCTGAGDETLRL
ncbi:unnamed protein product, partial [Heterosigma akashiwo]